MLQVFNADGSLQFDAGFELARIVSPFQTGVNDGVYPIPTSAVSSTVVPVITYAPLGLATPSIRRVGDNISWSFGSIPMQYRGDCSVLLVVR